MAGRVDPAFAPLADLFRGLVADGEERGALTVLIGGHPVVDLWGGTANVQTERPWAQDTLACCFSVTKGVFALLIHRLIDLDLITPDAPVASYWPAFAANGKEAITVGDVLTHRAGLPAVASFVVPGLLYDQPAMAAALAASPCVVASKAEPAYHNMTFGTLLAQIAEHATGSEIKALIRHHLTEPLGADFAIGLSQADRARTATLTQDDPDALFQALRDTPETLFAKSMTFFDPTEDFMSDRWQTTVIGSGSGHATAMGIARLYDGFINDTLLSDCRRMALQKLQTQCDADAVLGLPLRLGQGIELSNPPALDFGPNPDALGYWGAGGSQGFADPETRLSFGYVTGRMDPTLGSSPRCRALIKELYTCL